MPKVVTLVKFSTEPPLTMLPVRLANVRRMVSNVAEIIRLSLNGISDHVRMLISGLLEGKVCSFT